MSLAACTAVVSCVVVYAVAGKEEQDNYEKNDKGTVVLAH